MYRLRVFYKKEGIAIFISEKNFQRLMGRILRRMELPLKFSEGFSPHPRISFGYPLPLGIIGLNECFDIFLTKKIDIDSFLKRSRDILPEGITFTSARWLEPGTPPIHSIETFARYTMETSKDFDVEHLKKTGKLIKYTEGKIILEIRINDFSHKELVRLLLQQKIRSIAREILY